MPSRRLLLTAAAVLGPFVARAQQPAPRPAPPGIPLNRAVLLGVVDDSIRGGPLAGALVTVTGTTLSASTDLRGHFRIDSIAPGQYSLVVTHPLLDTLGLKVHSASFTIAGGQLMQVGVHTPSFEDVRDATCPAGGVGYGPSMIVGRVLKADSDEPAVGATVSLVFKDLLTSNSVERVRNGRTDATGTFAICKLPAKLTGNVQATLAGATTADLPVKLNNETIGTASLSIGVTGGGSAELRGTVTNKAGVPVSGAQVSVTGTTAVAVTGDDGTFALHALPAGTREAVVRKIGFAQMSRVVTLSSRSANQVAMVLDDAQVLKAVKVEGKLDGGLSKIGFMSRQKIGMGNYLTPDDIERRNPTITTDVLRAMAGLRLVYSGNGNTIQGMRGPSSTSDGCVNIFLDHTRFVQMNPGDVDNAMPVADLGAVEFYPSPNVTPVEFSVVGKECATLVLWSKTLLANQKASP